jgi:hypothetical protein
MNLAYPIPKFDMMAGVSSQQAAKSALCAGKIRFDWDLAARSAVLAACRSSNVRFHAGVSPKTNVQIQSPTGS